MIHRKPQPRAPSNHTALVSLPNINDIVTPDTPATSRPVISKRKFLNLYSSTVKKIRVSDEVENVEAELTENVEPEREDASEWSMPSDTKIALELMRSQFPKIEKASVQPFVLRSQLYSSVNDRTLVDRELEKLKLERSVRIFKLNTGQDDYAIMFMADYLAQIDTAKVRLGKKHSVEDMAVFDWFVSHVLPSHVDAGITHLKLVELLSEGGDVKDGQISLLMNAGLVTRQLVDSTAYWLAIPSIGFLLKSLSSGRKEIVSFLSRRKYREMLQVPLERRRLQYSVLGMRFHIRDLLGLGRIHVVPSPSGPIIRLSRD